MSTTNPPSPDDPAWVDDIVKRALERAGSSDPTPAVPATPNRAVAVRTPTPTAPVAPISDPTAPDPVSIPDADPEPTPSRPAAARVAPPEPQHQAPVAAPLVDEQVIDELFSPNADPLEPQSQHFDPSSGVDDRAADPSGPYPDSQRDSPYELEPVASMSQRMRGFLEWGAVIVGALAVALVIKTFLMQAYFIPSESMVPTLQVGDRVLVNKLSYEFGDVSRGDLIVFRRPPAQVSGEDDLIKRVVALEGETIEIRDNTVFITQAGSTTTQQLTEPYLVDGMTITGFFDTSGCAEATPTSCTVPEGSVFVMGDNRDRSRDGRSFGPISEDLIVGRAFLRVWPLGDISFL